MVKLGNEADEAKNGGWTVGPPVNAGSDDLVENFSDFTPRPGWGLLAMWHQKC